LKKLVTIVLVYVCASMGLAATEAARLVIDVSEAGQVTIEKAPIEIAKLKEILSEKKKAQPEIQVLIVASEKAGLPAVASVMDACRKADIKSFALQSR
jgi:biopolymer transport protein ExbD